MGMAFWVRLALAIPKSLWLTRRHGQGPDAVRLGGWLRDVEVRPVRGVEERRRWDALLAKHHYLPFRGLFSKSLRHVAVRREAWLALLGWQAGAFKVGVRDAWIGWSREQQFSRLHLIANNSRFAVLEADRVPNLASRALGLSLRRLSRDIRAAHRYLVLLAEALALDCYSILRNSGLLGKVMKIRHLLELGIFLPVPLHRARLA